MADPPKTSDEPPPEPGVPPRVPAPPSRAEVDQVSRDQALITDEWTGPAPDGGSGPTA